MKKSHFLLCMGFIALMVIGCKKDKFTAKDPKADYAYFGLTKRRYIEYKVQYIEHDSLLAQHDTTNFFYKTVIGEEYYDNEGRLAHEYLRYRKMDENSGYTFLSKWVILIADNQAQLVEENQRRIKLIFPITDKQEWDVNIYNDKGKMPAHYSSIHQPFSNNQFSTDSASTVEMYNYQTLIDNRLETETYAKNIGLVSKTSRELYFQFGQTEPYKGTELYMNIIKTGIE